MPHSRQSATPVSGRQSQEVRSFARARVRVRWSLVLLAGESSAIVCQSLPRLRIRLNTPNKFERGEREPNLLVIVAYCKAAEIPADCLIDDAWLVKDFLWAMRKK